MESVKEWALKYCEVNNLTYDELVSKALEFYRVYSDGQWEFYQYVTGSEFRKVIERTYRLLENYRPMVYTKAISERKEKLNFIEKNSVLDSNIRHIVTWEDTELIVIYNRKEIIAYAVISYEDEQNELGSYVYLHSIKIFNEVFTKHYRDMEKKIKDYIRKRGYNFYDRLISSEAKCSDFNVLQHIYNVKVSLEEGRYPGCKYSIEEAIADRENYRLLAYRIPSRFNIPLGTVKKIKLESGEDFFMWTVAKNHNTLLWIMIHNEKIYNVEHMYKVFSISAQILKEQGINSFYITIDKNAFPIVNELGGVDILSEERWMRKIL